MTAIRSTIRSPIRPTITSTLSTGGVAPPWSPAALFEAGEEGAWYDPSPSTCFTDAGTTPATVGDAVYQETDLSGNGNHRIQPSAASRPTLRQTAGGLYYLERDGTDDGMATAAIDFTGTDKMSVFAGVEKESDTSVDMIVELGADYTTNAGAFYLTGVNSTSKYTTAARGAAASNANQIADTTSAAYNAPHVGVISALHDISGDSTILRINGMEIEEAVGDKGAGNFGNYALNIGARNNAASLPFHGKEFVLIVRGAASNTQEISDAEGNVATKTGVTL